jgi:Protein of unknown function (DUF2802)
MVINIAAVLNIFGAIIGLLGFAGALWATHTLRRMKTRCASVETSLQAMRRELDLMASISLKTGRRVQRIESEYSGVANRVESVEPRGSAQFFDQAIAHARRGADPCKLAQQFGLSRGEADLVARLHGQKQRA